MAEIDGFGKSGIIAILLIISLSAFLLPTVIASASESDTENHEVTFTLSESETTDLEDTNTSVTINQINTSIPQYVNYTFESKSNSITTELENNTITNITIEERIYQVELTNINANTQEAMTKITYQTKNSNLVSQVWMLIPILLVFTPIAIFAKIITGGRKKL